MAEIKMDMGVGKIQSCYVIENGYINPTTILITLLHIKGAYIFLLIFVLEQNIQCCSKVGVGNWIYKQL